MAEGYWIIHHATTRALAIGKPTSVRTATSVVPHPKSMTALATIANDKNNAGTTPATMTKIIEENASLELARRIRARWTSTRSFASPPNSFPADRGVPRDSNPAHWLTARESVGDFDARAHAKSPSSHGFERDRACKAN